MKKTRRSYPSDERLIGDKSRLGRRSRLVRPKAIGVAAAVLLPTVGLTAPPASADQEPPREGPLETEAVFNVPGDDEKGMKIINRVREMIKGAPADSTIQFAQFRLRNKSVVTALEDAAKRGVNIQGIVDQGTTENPDYKRLEELLENSDSTSWLRSCPKPADNEDGKRGCNGSNAMHSKVFLFSETMGSKKVVSTSSSNLDKKKFIGVSGWNSLYTDVGNAELYTRYNDYLDYLNEVAKDPRNRDSNYYEKQPPVVTGDTKSYFYPRARGDTAVNTLNRVNCFEKPTTIRIGAWSLNRDELAETLRRKANFGCNVVIVANQIEKEACKTLADTPPIPLGTMEIRGFWSQEPHGIHQKNMMIRQGQDKAVFTGSQNFNNLSLRRNDEDVIRIRGNDKIYNAFVNNFDNKVKAAASVKVDSPAACFLVAPPEDDE